LASWTPSGNISGISPTTPMIGQQVTFTIDANNFGQLEYKQVDAAAWHRISHFEVFTGNRQINFTFWSFGIYNIQLLVSDGYTFVEVDSAILWVNLTNDTAGGHGYNVEFLQAQPHRAIAGWDTMHITYRTLKNNANLKIRNARGETTIYSTQLNAGYGVHKFALPNWAAIGPWNVSLEGNDTIYTEFYVIADENNFVEFTKNTYYDTEPFEIYLRHDQPVIVQFLHNGDPVGADLYLDTGQHPNGIMQVEAYTANPEPGNWSVELYSSNDRIKRQLLARDNCEVIYNSAAREAEYKKEGYDSILAMIAMAAPLFGGGEAGFWFLSLFILIGVVGMVLYMGGNKIKNDTIFLLLILTTLCLTMIGWLPWWVAIVAIIIAALAIGPTFTKKMGFGGRA
jgi:hypothetical protein